MKYKGQLYGKVRGKCVPLETSTEDIDSIREKWEARCDEYESMIDKVDNDIRKENQKSNPDIDVINELYFTRTGIVNRLAAYNEMLRDLKSVKV